MIWNSTRLLLELGPMCHHSDSNYGNGALYSPPLLIVVVLGRDPWIDPAMTALEEAG